MTKTAAPTNAADRVVELDHVRGLALFGIFLMNLPSFATAFDDSFMQAGVPGQTWYDQASYLVQDVLLSGKFNSMFSLLFAIGFTLQLERLQSMLPSPAATRVYVRRLATLLGMGLIHYLVFWNGDILHIYALLGFLLLWLRRWSDRSILILAAACLIAPSGIGLWRYFHLTPDALESFRAIARERSLADDQVFLQGSFWQGIEQTFANGMRAYSEQFSLLGEFSTYALILTTMCFGLLIGRHHWYRDIGLRLPGLVRWQWIALGIGLLTGAIVAASDILWKPTDGITVLGLLGGICYRLSRLALTAFYVLSFLRLLQRPLWRARLQPLAMAGRMALTNYLLQTAFGLCVFYGWGLGLRGQLGITAQFGLCIAFFTLVQVPASAWWFRRFTYGPMEYLWRAATYGGWPAFRVKSGA